MTTMNTPFEDLRREREAREKRQLEELAQRRDEEKKTYKNYKEMVEKFSDLVMPVLEQFRQAAYPHHQLVDCFSRIGLSAFDHFDSEGSWQIGTGAGYSATEHSWWECAVKVELEFDAQTQQPSGFICHCGGHRLVKARRSLIESVLRSRDKVEEVPYKPIRSTLSREGLVNALRQLHS